MCDRFHPAAPGALRADLTVSNWRVAGNTIRLSQALSNALEANWAILQAGGLIPGVAPRGTTIEGNTIYTSTRYGLGLGGPVAGAEISGNRIYMAAQDKAPIRAVQIDSGNLLNNTIQITSPPGYPLEAPVIFVRRKEPASFPAVIRGNTIRVSGAPNQVHIAIAASNPVLAGQVSVSNNNCSPGPCVHAMSGK